MVVKRKRCLGNLNTLEVHDTDRERVSCRLDEIRPEHRRWYDTLTEAKRDQPYDNCHWCLGGIDPLTAQGGSPRKEKPCRRRSLAMPGPGVSYPSGRRSDGRRRR